MFDFLKSLDEAEPLPPIEIGGEYDPFRKESNNECV